MTGSELRTRRDLGRAAAEVRPVDLTSLEIPGDKPRQLSPSELFYGLTLLLEREYIEPIQDERKLALGAIKGTVAGLWDPLSEYLPADHMAQRRRQLAGQFAGAGVELRLVFNPGELAKIRSGKRSNDPFLLFPALQVAMVAPGSAAERAGIKVGDFITGVNHKAVLSWKDVQAFREAQAQSLRGSTSAEAFRRKRAEFQRRARASVTVGRASDLLTMKDGRMLDLEWNREGRTMTASLVTGETRVPLLERHGEAWSLKLFSGASKAIAGAPLGSGAVTLDLRQSSLGDPSELRPALEALAPAGSYGALVASGRAPESLSLAKGSTSGRTYKLIVDRSTRGVAEVLALALQAKGLARLTGPTAGEPNLVEIVPAEEGAGYALNSARYEAPGGTR